MVSIINEHWEISSFKLVKKHVYGHQDDLNCPLTQLEALDYIMDIDDKDIIRQHIANN